MYKVFVLSTVQGFAYAEARRNGEYLTHVRAATNEQALRGLMRAVRIARHAGEFRDFDLVDNTPYGSSAYSYMR